MMSGCSTVKSGLVGAERENIVPFAEQTVAAMALERINFRDSEFAYLRAIAEPGAPEIERLRDMLRIAEKFRDDVVYYSFELVRISEMETTEQEKVQDYAEILQTMQQRISLRLDLDADALSVIDSDIRSQTSLLAALRAAQPLIDEAARKFDELIDELEVSVLHSAVVYLDDLIESHYGVYVEHNAMMNHRRDELLIALARIRDIRLGDAAAVENLRALSILSEGDLTVPDNPSSAQLTKLEEFVLAQMRRDNEIFEYVSVDIDAYLKAHAELDREEKEVLDGLNIARLQIVAWARSHQVMANGAREPGRWLKVVMDATSAARRVTY